MGSSLLAKGSSAQSVKATINATGAAPIYAIRAWVSCTLASQQTITGTYERTGNTVTVTLAGQHEKQVGDRFWFNATSGAATDGCYVVTSTPSTDIYTFEHADSGSTSGNMQRTLANITAGGNVAEVFVKGTGDIIVIMQIPMEDANYAIAPNNTLATVIDNAGDVKETAYFGWTLQTYNGVSYTPNVVSVMAVR